MATAARKGTVAVETAVVPATMTHDDLLALLGGTGMVAQNTSNFHRMKLEGGVINTDDGEIYPPQKGGKPSFLARIVKPPIYYNAFFLAENEKNGGFNAARIGRADLNGRFSKKYDDPAEQAADTNEANEVYEDIRAILGTRGSFKADIELQVVPDDGQMTGDETIYTMSLSTTSVFEWRGTARDQTSGFVSDKNFIVKLSELAIAKAVEAGADVADQKRAVLDALTSLRLGGVVAEVYILKATNEDNSQSWNIVSFNPIHIEPMDAAAPALVSGEVLDDSDDLPV